jgi:hypothetical protein
VQDQHFSTFQAAKTESMIVSDGTVQTSEFTLHKIAQHTLDIYNVVHNKCVTSNMDKMQN